MAPTQKVTKEDIKANPNSALAQVANTAARPGVLTTEWWTLVVAGIASSVIGAVGVSSNTATQIAAVIAPVAVGVIYAFTRAHTKGILADVLEAAFPQSGAGAATGNAGVPGYCAPAASSLPNNAAAMSAAGVSANPGAAWPSGDYVPTGDLQG